MTASVKASGAPTREEFSERLLRGSVKKYYEPVVDVDWDAPLDPDKFFLPPKSVSLYGTPLWDAMTREQRIELSRQEFVNTLSAGIWFENILNQALLRDLMHADPTARSTHYALTEMGDETRHMVMFGRAIEKVGGKPMRPKRYQRMIINLLPLTFRGALLWVAALVGEEIFDSLQRNMMDDPGPATRRPAHHANPRHRGSSPHPVRPRRGTQARRRDAVAQPDVGGQSQRRRRAVLPAPVHQRRAVSTSGPGRQGGSARRPHQRPPPRRAGARVRPAGRVPHRHRLDGSDRAPAVDPHPLPPGHAVGATGRRRRHREDRELYDGPAVLRVGDVDHTVRVRLIGHLEPIDGQYHWQGAVSGEIPDDVLKHPKATLTVDGRTAQARITERTPQGNYGVVGVGTPPFA